MNRLRRNLVRVQEIDAVNVQLYQGDWPIDLQYQSLPDGVPEISDETLQEVVELPGSGDSVFISYKK